MITRVALLAASWIPGAGAMPRYKACTISLGAVNPNMEVREVRVKAGELKKTLWSRGKTTRQHITFPIPADTGTSGAKASVHGEVSDDDVATVSELRRSGIEHKSLKLTAKHFEEESDGFSRTYEVSESPSVILFSILLDCGHQAILPYDNSRADTLKIEATETDTVARIHRDGEEDMLEIVTWVAPPDKKELDLRGRVRAWKWWHPLRQHKKKHGRDYEGMPITLWEGKDAPVEGRIQYQRTMILITPDGKGQPRSSIYAEDRGGVMRCKDKGFFDQPVKLTTHNVDDKEGIRRRFIARTRKYYEKAHYAHEKLMESIQKAAKANKKHPNPSWWRGRNPQPQMSFPNTACGPDGGRTMSPNLALHEWMMHSTGFEDSILKPLQTKFYQKLPGPAKATVVDAPVAPHNINAK